VLAPLPVRAFPGIGRVGEEKLHAVGYQTLGAIADADVIELRKIFGAWAPLSLAASDSQLRKRFHRSP
jgi:nucleotidyltransferase/DNA polymerase involved in DNA repair